jgi:hypothetical protein
MCLKPTLSCKCPPKKICFHDSLESIEVSARWQSRGNLLHNMGAASKNGWSHRDFGLRLLQPENFQMKGALHGNDVSHWQAPIATLEQDCALLWKSAQDPYIEYVRVIGSQCYLRMGVICADFLVLNPLQWTSRGRVTEIKLWCCYQQLREWSCSVFSEIYGIAYWTSSIFTAKINRIQEVEVEYSDETFELEGISWNQKPLGQMVFQKNNHVNLDVANDIWIFSIYSLTLRHEIAHCPVQTGSISMSPRMALESPFHYAAAPTSYWRTIFHDLLHGADSCRIFEQTSSKLDTSELMAPVLQCSNWCPSEG